MKRETKVVIPITDKYPYPIKDNKGNLIGETLTNGEGVYLKDVVFTINQGKPEIKGVFLGTVDEGWLNYSKGKGVMFDDKLNKFVTSEREIKDARMVIIYGGIIKVTIEND